MDIFSILTSNTVALVAVTIMISVLADQIGGGAKKTLIMIAVVLGAAFVFKNAQQTHTARYDMEERSVFGRLF